TTFPAHVSGSRETAPPARPNQTTFLDEVIMTFSSPMAWLLVVALILTWSGVAIILFDLLDYKTLAGLPPPAAIAKRGLRMRGKQKLSSARASVPADVTGQEGTDWLQLLWNFVASLVAPDEEEEGIHQLTETFTRKGAPSHHDSPFHKDQENKRLT
uniref:Triadin n=1 Tax=Takifugu rubripes TaxID=31033 RepID=A0A3B5K0S1_TAKRU